MRAGHDHGSQQSDQPDIYIHCINLTTIQELTVQISMD